MHRRGVVVGLATVCEMGASAWAGVPGSTPIGDTYSVVTALSNNGLFLPLEQQSSPPRDNVVTFDGVSEGINPYIGVFFAQSRTVSEHVTSNPDGTLSIFIEIRGEDLFPGGVTLGGSIIRDGYVAIGRGVNTALGGNDPLLWNQPSGVQVVSAALRFSTPGLGVDPAFTFDLTAIAQPTPWDGELAFHIPGAAGRGYDAVQILLTTSNVPAPGAAGMLLLGALAATRRRR